LSYNDGLDFSIQGRGDQVMTSQWPREDLHGVQVVPLTAFDEQGQLALSPMRWLISRLFHAGVRAFIPCAGSSEFHTLQPAEILAVLQMVRDVLGHRARMLAPVGMQLSQAIELGHAARAAGADGVLVMPLVHPYLSDAGARDYYLALMDQLQCPTVIYKKAAVPSHDLLLELAEHPCLLGVKYAGLDVSAFQAVVQRDGGRLDWYCGNAERYAPFFALAGAPGYTSGAANICPRLSLAMHAALRRCDWPEALRLQQIILPIELFRARDENSYNVSFLKQAIRAHKMDFGPPRPPYRRLALEEAREIDRLLPPILEAERQLEVASQQTVAQ
jgi:4-hydroxy-tetrahydrodipicolinate synthase